ncbi:MAG: hypothetical protein GXP62_18535 [Oligoflexia bacterium]|nr:hypothetical protein [Oligoflexia bacterium]
MKRIAWIIPGLALTTVVACNGNKPDDTGAGLTDNTGNTGTCSVEVNNTTPADGDASAYYRSTIEFELSEPDPNGTPTITVADGAGTAVAGSSTLNDDADVVIFTPDVPLDAATSYTATLDYCAGSPSITFTTSSLGGSLDADVIGNAYVIDLDGADFVEPAGIADLLLGQLNNSILLGVTATSPDLEMIGAISVEGSTDQDLCNESIPFPAADFSNSPYFEMGPADTTISMAGFDVEILQLSITGTFASDGSYIGGATLGGELDARLLAPLVGDLLGTKDPDVLCQTVAGFGVSCQTCSSDGEPYCLAIYVRDITADSLGTSLVERTAKDIAADKTCKK